MPTTTIPQDIGAKLRHTRQLQGLSLQDVEAMTVGQFKSSAVGAYERGERIIPTDRLVQLAKVYGVPADHLLPTIDIIIPDPEPPADDGTVNARGLIDLVSCSYRQVDHWTRIGLVRVADGVGTPGSGYARRFTPREVFIAKVVHCLSGFGFQGSPLATAVANIRDHSPAARLVYIQADGTTHWGPGDVAAIVIDLDQLRLKPQSADADGER